MRRCSSRSRPTVQEEKPSTSWAPASDKVVIVTHQLDRALPELLGLAAPCRNIGNSRTQSVVPVGNLALTHWCCSLPRTRIASVRPTVWTARGIGASLCSGDRCVRASLQYFWQELRRWHKAQHINLQRPLIGSEYQPIRDRQTAVWVCGRTKEPACGALLLMCRDQRAQAESSMTRQKLMGWKLLSLSASTSALTVPNVLFGRCFIPS
jgi:hypothetical protein